MLNYLNRSNIVKRIASILLILIGSTARAGPVTYQFAATGELAMGLITPRTEVITYPITPPYAAEITVSYTPGAAVGLSPFALAIQGGGSGFTSAPWNGAFEGNASIGIILPNAQGLDEIDFYAVGTTGQHAWMSLFAPAGTLTSADVLPASLDGFVQYGMQHVGGYFSYEHPVQPGDTSNNWSGYADGFVGDPPGVPEPGSIVLLVIGIIAAVAVRSLRC